MIGAIMGIGGALMGALNANSASNQSWQRQQQLMEIQAELNRFNNFLRIVFYLIGNSLEFAHLSGYKSRG